MTFFTFLYGRSLKKSGIFVLWLGFAVVSCLQAQTNSITLTFAPINAETNAAPVATITNSSPALASNEAVTNVAPAIANPPTPVTTLSASESQALQPQNLSPAASCTFVIAALLTLASIGGFLLFYCGLTRAKNVGHTSTLLLVGVVFGLIGYWIGGFALQTGGIGDDHAALNSPLPLSERQALDHELGAVAFGHHWGLMGNSGFFGISDEPVRNDTALLFLGEAALLALAVAASLGAALERGRLLPMALFAFLIGAVIYPLVANWAWGGGWLAELGREFGLGHGLVDIAGSGVVHETAGTLALVIAIVLGPRHGRFGRENSIRPIPGHHIPFAVLGTVILLMSWTAVNAFAYTGPGTPQISSTVGIAAMNVLLAAGGGLLVAYIATAWRKQRPDPVVLCRGLLGAVVAVSGSSALIDPWAAFLIGMVAALVVQGAMNFLIKRRIDDPVGASAVQGAGGAWGIVAVGLFANGSAGTGINGIDGGVRGLFFGGAWHQLVAQVIGATTDFVVVFILGYACLGLIQKILGTRVDLVDEVEGLDWPETGAFGYQGDIEPEK